MTTPTQKHIDDAEKPDFEKLATPIIEQLMVDINSGIDASISTGKPVAYIHDNYAMRGALYRAFQSIYQQLLADRDAANGWCFNMGDAPSSKRCLVGFWHTNKITEKQRFIWMPATHYKKFTLPMHLEEEGGEWHEPSGQFYAKAGWYQDEDDEGVMLPVHFDPDAFRLIDLPSIPERKE